MVAGYGPPPVAHRWVPAVIGAVAAIGFLCTLLPMWSLTVHPSAFRSGSRNEVKGAINIDVGFYDWVVSGRPVGAILPLVLALAVAVAVAASLSGPDRNLWGLVAAAATTAAILVIGTAIRPDSKREVTGPIAERMSPSDVAGIKDPAPIDAGVGLGLVLALVTVAVVGGLAAWQYFAAREVAPERQSG